MLRKTFGSWTTGDPVNTIEVTPPVHNDGDLLVAFIFVDDNQNISCPETGWTEDTELQSSYGSDSAIAIFTRIASSEPSTITFNRGGTTGYCAGIICKITGHDPDTWVDATSTTNAADGPTKINMDEHDPASITTVTPGAIVFSFCGSNTATNQARTAPSGYTLETSVGTVDAAAIASKVVLEDGTEDPGVWSGWGSDADTGSITFAVRPAIVRYVDAQIESTGPPFVVTEPTGAAEGDMMIAWGNINSQDGTWSFPADFTEIVQQNSGAGATGSRSFLAYKVRGSTSGFGYSFGYDGTDASCRVCVACYRGSDDPLVIEPTYIGAHYNENSNLPNEAANPITTLSNAARVLLCYTAAGQTISPGPNPDASPTGYSQRVAGLAASNVYLCDKIVDTPGVETPGAFNFDTTTSGSSADQRTYTVGIAELISPLTSIVKSTERVTIDWDATSEPVTQNLSKGQNVTKCVPFFTKRLVSGSLSDDFRERTMKVEMIDNAGTPAVRVSAAGKSSANDHRIECYVVEFETGITVQQVDADIADTASSANISITDVGAQTSAFFLFSYQYTHGSAQDRADYACVRPIWNGAATNSITVERTGSTGTIDGMLYVVSCSNNEFSVQHEDISVVATDELTNNTITAVNMASSFLLTHFRSSEAEDDPLDWSFVADLSSTTNVRVRRSIAGASNAAANVGVQVVTALGGQWSVQRGDFTTTSNLTETTTISAVDLTRAFVKTGTHETGINSFGTSDLVAGTIIDEIGPAAHLSANNIITWTRESVSETGNIIPWEVIQFSAGLDNAILIPTGPIR